MKLLVQVAFFCLSFPCDNNVQQQSFKIREMCDAPTRARPSKRINTFCVEIANCNAAPAEDGTTAKRQKQQRH